MALSEHEKRVLDEIERTLSTESPRLATSLRSASSVRLTSSYFHLTWPRHWARGVPARAGGLLIGLVLLALGVIADSGIGTVGAVIGYVLIVACVSAMLTAARRRLWHR